MKLFNNIGWSGLAVCVGLLVTGCATYYKVTDPQSGRNYYTQEVNRERGGAASFTDAGSGSTVTIQNSEVKEISGDEFDAGVAAAKTKPAPAAPAPVAPPAPAPSSSAPAPAEKSATGEASSAAPAEESK
jgi:hypothetical protein